MLHLPLKSVIVFTLFILVYIPVIQAFIVYIDFQSFFNFIVCNMAPKKTQSPLVAQRAEQKRVAKVSWKESQRQLLVTLLNSSRAVQAAMCAYEYNPVDNDEDTEKIIKAAVVEEELLLQKKRRFVNLLPPARWGSS